ncbi:MAG: L-2-hydroxyglutarate oxidase [Thiolinea sp.]
MDTNHTTPQKQAETAQTLYDYIIIGGGIVGISTAWQLQQRKPEARILLLEKEAEFAQHQTGHNSGVIHAGVYYAPGSLKAKFCKAGVTATIDFCQQHNIDYEQCGKLLVATNALEKERMLALYQRALQNELDLELLDAEQLHEHEPNISGVGAILVKDTAIVNYRRICHKMAGLYTSAGGKVCLQHEVTALTEFDDHIRVQVQHQKAPQVFHTRYLISCSGLMADRITRMLDIKTDFQIIPFRGEYYQLPARHNRIVKHLIYPIPDPALPFLGVHLTRMIDGSVTVGPNAVQGWKREGYGRVNFSLTDVREMLAFPGFWKVLIKNLRPGLAEMWNSLWKPGYLKLVQKYCPQITLADLQPYPAGVRAQAVSHKGELIHDFLFAESPRSLHVCNAPSPAATSAIPIGNYICDKVLQE